MNYGNRCIESAERDMYIYLPFLALFCVYRVYRNATNVIQKSYTPGDIPEGAYIKMVQS